MSLPVFAGSGAFYTNPKHPCGYAMGVCKQIIIGGIVGGITFFMRGFISWVVLPWHQGTVRQDAGVMEVVKNIDDHLPETGVYYFPPMSFDQQDPDAWKEWEDMHRDSSRGMIFYTAEVGDPMPPMRLVQGFLADVACSGTAQFAGVQGKGHICCFAWRVCHSLCVSH